MRMAAEGVVAGRLLFLFDAFGEGSFHGAVCSVQCGGVCSVD